MKVLAEKVFSNSYNTKTSLAGNTIDDELLHIRATADNNVEQMISGSPFCDLLGMSFTKLAVLEFDRDRKSMSVLCQKPRIPISFPTSNSNEYFQRLFMGKVAGNFEVRNAFNGKGLNVLLVKGAADMVVKRCNRLQLEDGMIVPISKEMRTSIEAELGM